MKQILVMIVAVALVGCASTPTNWNWVSDPSDENNVKIEKAIRERLKKPTGKLTKADLERVESAHLNYESLLRRNNGITLTKLTEVPKGLEKLTQLTRLNLENNQLTDVKGLENFTQLKMLELQNNQLTDVTGLEKLTYLEYLHLTNNRLTSVKGLEKLTYLEDLGLDNNRLTEVKGLEKLTQLKHLSLMRNRLTNVKGLEKLTQLKRLTLWNNPELTKAQIAELQKALPNVVIRSGQQVP